MAETYSVNDKGIESLRKLAGTIEQSIENIGNTTQNLVQVVEDYADTIGPHQKELYDALIAIKREVKKASDPAQKLASTAERVAAAYEQIKDKNRIKARGKAGAAGVAGAAAGVAAGVAAAAGAGAAASGKNGTAQGSKGAGKAAGAGSGADGSWAKLDDPKLESKRQTAVRLAWKEEVDLVLKGKGTRNWTPAQQAELLEYGSVSGFEGQHMKSAKKHPEYADNPNNIQFVTYEEHFYGAHGGNWRNDADGYFDPVSGKVIPFKEGEEPHRPTDELSQPIDPGQAGLLNDLGREFGYGRREDREISKETHKGEKSNHIFGD